MDYYSPIVIAAPEITVQPLKESKTQSWFFQYVNLLKGEELHFLQEAFLISEEGLYVIIE